MNLLRSVFALLALGLFVVPSVSAQELALGENRERPILTEAFVLGGLGNGDIEFGGSEVPLDLDPTTGFGVRAEARFIPYLGIGLGAAFSWLRPTGPRDTMFNVDLSLHLRPHLYIMQDSDLSLEIYALLPFGFSRQTNGDGANGFHAGALLGGRAVIGKRLGFFGEIGYQRTQVWPDGGSIAIGQVRLHLGVSYAF